MRGPGRLELMRRAGGNPFAKGGRVEVVTAPQLFPTPPAVAARLVELAEPKPHHHFLEPSAGTGRLLDALLASPWAGWSSGGSCVAVERSQGLASALGAKYGRNGGRPHSELSRPIDQVVCADFLDWAPLSAGIFDRVIMNPPFAMGADIKHVFAALSCCKPGGRVVAIVADGPRQRRQLKPNALHWEDLPAGTFEGTGVRSAIVVLERQS